MPFLLNPLFLKGLAVVLIVAATFGFGYLRGSESRNTEVAKLLATIQMTKLKAQELAERDPVIEKQVVIEYRDRIVRVREVEAEIPRQVEVIRRESPDCVLPPAFRVLHDSGALGHPSPEAPAGVDAAASVACDVAAETIARNYAEAHKNAEQLKALQKWVSETSQ